MPDVPDGVSGAVVFILASVIGGIVWMVRLEGRVSMVERMFSEHLADGARRADVLHEQQEKMLDRMDALSEKITSLYMNCIRLHGGDSVPRPSVSGVPRITE